MQDDAPECAGMVMRDDCIAGDTLLYIGMCGGMRTDDTLDASPYQFSELQYVVTPCPVS
jgi:hypothetical protein